MHQQSTRVALVSMPATEIVGSMVGIQHPLKINRQHLANHPGHQQLLYLCAGRGISIIESDPHLAPGLLLSVNDALSPSRVDGQRFFGDYVAAQLHRPAYIMIMKGVLTKHDDRIWTILADHAIECFGRVQLWSSGRNAWNLRGQNESSHIPVAQGDDSISCRIFLSKRL